MRKPHRILVVTVVIPFMLGCTATLAQPLPESAARPGTAIRGVILRTSGPDERIEYSETTFVEWTDSTVVILGIVRGEGRDVTIQDACPTLLRMVVNPTGGSPYPPSPPRSRAPIADVRTGVVTLIDRRPAPHIFICYVEFHLID